MNWRNMLPQLVLGALVVWGAAVPQAQANSIWTYAGSGDLGHTVTAFVELDIDLPVAGPTEFGFPDEINSLLNSGFTITGPNFFVGAPPTVVSSGSFTFEHHNLVDAAGLVTPPDDLGCLGDINAGCFWGYVGGIAQQVLTATIFNDDDWRVDAFIEGVVFAGIGNGPDGDNIFGEFVLSGTGQWTPPTSGTNPVPEPSTMFLLGSGLVGLVGWQMRKRKA